MFICGSGSFSNQDDQDHENINESGFSSPRAKRSKRTTSFCKIIGRDSSNKNPYAERGLDKFYALLADLDDKKQKIYTKMGPEEISFVRFVYANDSDRVKPIVIKVKDQKNKQEKILTANNSFVNPSTSSAEISTPDQTSTALQKEELVEDQKDGNKKKKRYLRCNGATSFKLDNLRRPYYYFAAIVVLILVFLAIYGRSFAILCTSIGWYLVPIVGSSSSSSAAATSSERKLKRKKEYVRKQSERNIHVHSRGPSSPTSVITNRHGRS